MGCQHRDQPNLGEEGVRSARAVAMASLRSVRQNRQHPRCPSRRFDPRPSGRGLSSGYSRRRHYRRFRFLRPVHLGSPFLRPFAPGPLRPFLATMGVLTPHRLSRPVGSPCFTRRVVPTIPSPTTRCSAPLALSRYPSAAAASRLSQRVIASPFVSRLAEASSRIEFVILWTGRAPPAALHLALQRRSCSRFQAGERLPGGSFIPRPVSLAGALTQASRLLQCGRDGRVTSSRSAVTGDSRVAPTPPRDPIGPRGESRLSRPGPEASDGTTSAQPKRLG